MTSRAPRWATTKVNQREASLRLRANSAVSDTV
jgi:hypothetical protein